MADKDFEIKNQWLLKYTGKNKSVVIPDGIIVIGRNAFSNKKLEEVYIPDTVRKIDMFAFENCNKLEKIRMSQNIDVIRSSAFRNCINLEEIQLPDKDILLEAGAFCGCVKLIKSPLSEKMVIGGNPFSGCKKLADENGWLIIKDVLYEWFGDAEDVVIPMGVKKIAGTFAANKNIKKLTIPGTVKQISGAVFSDCTNLQEVMMDEGVEHIDYNAFYGCSKLKDIKIPESLEKSDYKVFENCPGLANEQKLIVIDGVLYNYIGRAKKVRIPKGVTTISENAFDMRQKRGVDNLETVELPDGLTSIGKYAFRDCKKLKNINFPESLVEIEASAFFGCNELCWKRLSNADGFVIINDQLIKYVGQEKIVHVPVDRKSVV